MNDQYLEKKDIKIDQLRNTMKKYSEPDAPDNQIIPQTTPEQQSIIRSKVVNALHSYQEKSTGISGAAMGYTLVVKNSVSLGRALGRANVGIAIATTIISIGLDVYGWFRGEYSGMMLARKITNTIASGVGGFVAGGTGAYMGAVIGGLLGPVGAVLGALIGGACGGYKGGKMAGEKSDSFTSRWWSDADEAKHQKKLSYLAALKTFSDVGMELKENISDAHIEMLKKQFSLKYHPDRPGGDKEIFIEKMAAYETIMAYRKADREGKLGCVHVEDLLQIDCH